MTQSKNTGFAKRIEKRLIMNGIKLSTIMVALAISGCASYQKDHFTVGSVPSDYRTKHPIVVSQSDVTSDILISPGMREMSFEIRNKVLEFVGRYRRAGASQLRVIIPSGSHNATAARAVSGDIINFARSQGVNSSDIRLESYHASNHGDAATLRLSFDAVSAKVHSKCGQWTDDLISNSDNVNYQNFGCATQNNLAGMIANPEDLISPRGQSEIDATRRDTIIENWRTDGSAALPSLL